MELVFHKYHGAGNDFIIIDNRRGEFSELSEQDAAIMCNRHFGVGADGLMLLELPPDSEDFSMRYFNSDGRESTMCGNGGRCIAAFAHRAIFAKKKLIFNAVDGTHTAEILKKNGDVYLVRLKMIDVTDVEKRGDYYFLNTGSPHLVCFVGDVNAVDIIPEARALRYNPEITAPGGANVNFVQTSPEGLHIRTYERGVEDETLACGTGNVAAAIASIIRQGNICDNKQYHTELHTLGGKLQVDFTYKNGMFADVFLTGESCFVFTGKNYNCKSRE